MPASAPSPQPDGRGTPGRRPRPHPAGAHNLAHPLPLPRPAEVQHTSQPVPCRTGQLEPRRPKGPPIQAAAATGLVNGDPNTLPGPSAQATRPHSPEPQEANPGWVVVTALAPPCPQLHIRCPNVGPSTDADEGSEPCPVTIMRQRVLQSWGGRDLTQDSFLEAAAYTWPPDRAGSWRMKGQHEQDPEAGASLAPEDRGARGVAAGG